MVLRVVLSGMAGKDNALRAFTRGSYGSSQSLIQCGMGKHELVHPVAVVLPQHKQLGRSHQMGNMVSKGGNACHAPLMPDHLDEARRVSTCLSDGIGNERCA